MSPIRSGGSPIGVARLVRRTLGGHVLVLLALGLVASVVLLENRPLLRDARVARDRMVDTAALSGDVLAAQTSVRGFLLGGRPELLDDYRHTWPQVERSLRKLQAHGSAEERTALASAAGLLHRWRTESAEREIALVRAGNRAAAIRLFRTRHGAELVDTARSMLGRAAAAQRRAATSADHDVFALRLLLGVAIIGSTLLAALSALLLMRSLTRDIGGPLGQLVATVDRLGAGELSARAPVEGVWETKVVATAVNEMAGRVEHEVTALREVDELKDTFVSSVSHELRTPLTSIRGYLEALIEGDAGPLSAEQREYAGIAYRNAGRLEALISDLLTLSRLESGRAALERKPISLSGLLEDLVRELTPAASAKDIELRREVPEGLGIVADPMRLHQTFGNLLSNAIKFSPPGESVTLRAHAKDEELWVEVADRGPGIPDDELARIGQRFFRSREAATIEGTGLGLAISREIIEQHGGRLEIESVRGNGSTFRVCLPARRAGDGTVVT